MLLGCSEQIVLFGAGALGQKILKGLRTKGITPIAFCDNNPALWNQKVEGLPILSAPDATSRFGRSAVFVVCVWHPSKRGMRHHIQQLQNGGCKAVLPFTEIYLRFPDTFLPSGLFETPDGIVAAQPEINAAAALFEAWDKDEYERQIRLRFRGEILGVTDPVPGLQYFPEDLISLSEDEVFVDCGAYNGDTLQDFLSASGGQFQKFIGLEPDPTNFEALQSKIEDPRVTARPFAVGDQTEVLSFFGCGTDASQLAPEGNMAVQCVRLDELLAQETPTYIKMDIEGAEPKALLGARETIRRCRPKLAICVYHEPEHLWTIPLLLKELQPKGKLYLRPHLADGWDLVCYSLPN